MRNPITRDEINQEVYMIKRLFTPIYTICSILISTVLNYEID